MKDTINYWTNLIHDDIGLKDKEMTLNLFKTFSESGKLEFFTIDMTGIFAYMIGPTLTGGRCLSEMVFYIKPIYRGKVKLVRKYIKRAEKIAKENGCDLISIGANIGYKDGIFISLLKRWGYMDNVVAKEL